MSAILYLLQIRFRNPDKLWYLKLSLQRLCAKKVIRFDTLNYEQQKEIELHLLQIAFTVKPCLE